MKRSNGIVGWRVLWVFVAITGWGRHQACCETPGGSGSVGHGAIATVHREASEAARETLRDGGNAVDSAIAAALTLGVVDGHNSGIGGGCFMLIRSPGGAIEAIDGRETAPAASRRDMYVRDGKVQPMLSQSGALAVGTPGALAAYQHASSTYGRKALSELLEQAARRARAGFKLPPNYVERITPVVRDLAQSPDAAALLLDSQGQPRRAGEWLVQPDLARSYRSIARQGADWFYRGPYAQRAGEWMEKQGGVLTARDLAEYRIRLREPVRTKYRGYEIVGFPPPSSGGVHVAQILNILESFDLSKWRRESPEWIHSVAEAMKLAFADRAKWMGDPDYTKVPRGLLDKGYAASMSSRIQVGRVLQGVTSGVPPHAGEDYFGKHTTHFTVVDDEGWWVACTATINTSFGSKVIIPGTGIFLNNEMDDFSTAPGVANFFGLMGGEANAVEPGKRPLSSMSPTLVLKDGVPVFTVGAAGGPTIISQVVLAILGFVDAHLSVEDSLQAPRFHHQWSPDELVVEATLPSETVATLRQWGHRVKVVRSLGAAQAAGRTASGLGAAADLRVTPGSAVVW